MSNSPERNYDSISPSAKALLLLKGLTDIPFAREAAELIMAPEQYVPDYEQRDFTLWMRVIHFEVRYKSIDQLLAGLPITNILELSSGFSFRGLKAVQDSNVNYIDTDLPELIKVKTGLTNSLKGGKEPNGKLETRPLNALDENEFSKIAESFPDGQIAIVNEGLLMYLGMEEKKKLCGIIRSVLQKRGGYWITADIYLKTSQERREEIKSDKLQRFFEEHHIHDNMFQSFEEAEAFFKSEGFVIDADAELQYAASPLLNNLLQSATEEQLAALGKGGKIHATWRLKLA